MNNHTPGPETTIPELLKILEQARIALTFYREWMLANSGYKKTTYPYGVEVEQAVRAVVAKAKER